jgi:hypothetical protein
VVASHARSWARRQTITDPAHVRSAAQLRASYQQAGSSSTGRDLEEDGLVRDLAGYDTRFGIDFSGGIDTAADRGGGTVTGAAPKDTIKQIQYYAAALKAPRIRDSAARLADRARDRPALAEAYARVTIRNARKRADMGNYCVRGPGPTNCAC